jgi:hypothetical protein
MEEPPTNEFLSDILSREINSGLREARMVAEEIRNMRREKEEEPNVGSKAKPRGKIGFSRVAKGSNWKGTSLHSRKWGCGAV